MSSVRSKLSKIEDLKIPEENIKLVKNYFNLSK